jgi:Kef-type K+ transport system membrane component KefB/nucleotide-binding universal stress UspA family protein
MEIFTAASHNNVLALLTQFTTLLLAARLMGELLQRFGQPSVIGEILAGVILGPSFLGKLFPAIQGIIIPENPVQGYLLEAISLIGAIFLLLITGLETDVRLIRRHARTALGVSLGGLTLTFISGFILGQYLPDYLLTESTERLIFSLFIATSMSISAIPVISKILIDMKIIRRDISQTIIASGMTDDTIGWVLLSIIAGLASGKTITLTSVALSAGNVLLFIIVSFTFGHWLVKKSLDFVQDKIRSTDKFLTLVVVLTFTWGAISHFLHLEPILGAFVMGILFGQMPRFPHEVREKLQSISLGIFSPIFFAVAGLKVNLLYLIEPDIFGIAIIVIVIATLGKVIGTYAGARLIGGCDHWSALSFGAALNARGAMEIIVATIGLSLGILTREMFSVIVLMAVTTSIMAPAALRWVLRHVKPSDDEIKRLKQEEMTQNSPIGRIHRVLMPVRDANELEKDASIQSVKLSLLKYLSLSQQLSITFLQVIPPNAQFNDSADQLPEKVISRFEKQELIKRIIRNKNVSRPIISEAKKEYELLVLGAAQPNKDSDTVFSTIIDNLIRFSPCTTMIVHANEIKPNWALRKILVPTNGSLASKHAAELAFLLAAGSEAQVIILNILVREGSSSHQTHEAVFERQLAMSHKMVESIKELADGQNIPCSVEVRIAPSADTEILHLAQHENIDLIVLGTEVRVASDKLFLGPRLERILKGAPCPVAVLNTI